MHFGHIFYTNLASETNTIKFPSIFDMFATIEGTKQVIIVVMIRCQYLGSFWNIYSGLASVGEVRLGDDPHIRNTAVRHQTSPGIQS